MGSGAGPATPRLDRHRQVREAGWKGSFLPTSFSLFLSPESQVGGGRALYGSQVWAAQPVWNLRNREQGENKTGLVRAQKIPSVSLSCFLSQKTCPRPNSCQQILVGRRRDSSLHQFTMKVRKRNHLATQLTCIQSLWTVHAFETQHLLKSHPFHICAPSPSKPQQSAFSTLSKSSASCQWVTCFPIWNWLSKVTLSCWFHGSPRRLQVAQVALIRFGYTVHLCLAAVNFRLLVSKCEEKCGERKKHIPLRKLHLLELKESLTRSQNLSL